MKTKHNNQKTENRNFRVMVLRTSAVVFSLVLISLTTISAQELIQQFFNTGSYGKMMVADAGNINEFEKADAVMDAVYSELSAKTEAEAFACETETDEVLNIESWMTDENSFSSNVLTVTEETDDALNVEAWMIPTSNFASNSFAVEKETDPELRVENWMLDSDTFVSTTLHADLDAELKVESWMLDHECFKWDNELTGESMELEAWMTDDNLWGF